MFFFFFLYGMWTLPWFGLKEKVESGRDMELVAQTFIFLREALTGLYVTEYLSTLSECECE